MLEGSILQKLRDAHQTNQGGNRSLNFGVYYKNTLVALCHALEDSILSASDCAPLMITAFQRGKWYLQEAERYGDIADRAQQIVIMASPDSGFAEHPTSQRSNVALVNLEAGDPVGQEWHLIIASPNYTAMVLCQELSEADYGAAGIPSDDLERKFYGFWTFEPSLVLETAALAIDHIGQYDPDFQKVLREQLSRISNDAQSQAALCGTPTADHLGEVVSRVIDYLCDSQRSLEGSPSHTSASLKGLDRNLVSNELQAFLRVSQLIDQTDLSNPMAGAEVASLAEAIGQLLDLPAWQLHRLRLAGLLHRIAFLQPSHSVLSAEPAASAPQTDAPACPLVPGVQVLRTMPRLRAIAIIITHQTEWWNGAGQPAGLGGDAIPLESRILGLASHFQQQLAALQAERTDTDESALASAECLAKAFSACEADAGDRWDPKVLEALSLLVRGLSQGIDLSVSLPKIASGLWLLDSHSEEDLFDVPPSPDEPAFESSSVRLN